MRCLRIVLKRFEKNVRAISSVFLRWRMTAPHILTATQVEGVTIYANWFDKHIWESVFETTTPNECLYYSNDLNVSDWLSPAVWSVKVRLLKVRICKHDARVVKHKYIQEDFYIAVIQLSTPYPFMYSINIDALIPISCRQIFKWVYHWLFDGIHKRFLLKVPQPRRTEAPVSTFRMRIHRPLDDPAAQQWTAQPTQTLRTLARPRKLVCAIILDSSCHCDGLKINVPHSVKPTRHHIYV